MHLLTDMLVLNSPFPSPSSLWTRVRLDLRREPSLRHLRASFTTRFWKRTKVSRPAWTSWRVSTRRQPQNWLACARTDPVPSPMQHRPLPPRMCFFMAIASCYQLYNLAPQRACMCLSRPVDAASTRPLRAVISALHLAAPPCVRVLLWADRRCFYPLVTCCCQLWNPLPHSACFHGRERLHLGAQSLCFRVDV